VIEFTGKGALFDFERRYRYTLWRSWAPNAARFVNFVMLNPSTADENVLDPTVTRCARFAHDWGYDGIYVTNIFALRATDPRELYQTASPIGVVNNEYLEKTASTCSLVIVAWGVHGAFMDRGAHVAELLAQYSLKCLGVTKDGQPRHPLYLRHDTVLSDFRMAAVHELAAHR
jgi:hypothetical protein